MSSRTPQDRQASIERGVLDTLHALLIELGLPRAGQSISLDDALDRTLGLGSLERVELLLRLEQSFGVELPDSAVARASLVRELVQAIATAGPALTARLPAPEAPQAPATAAPMEVRLLTEVLRWHAERHPERIHLTLRQEDGSERPLSYGELWASASAVATALVHSGLARGETVALMLRTELGFFSCFFGVLLAGGIPVPLYPPFRLDHLEEYVERQVHILRNAEARVLITFDEVRRVGNLLKAQVPSLRATYTPGELAWTDAPAPVLHLEPQDAALIQYTSGSTGHPKGVLLTHENLLANIRASAQAGKVNSGDVLVSWLPLYHDMGLIGSWLFPLYYGLPLALLSPQAFLTRPARWLHALHRHRGTLSSAPNFAYDLCVRKVRDEELQGLDLSSWRVALNGSEAVSPETLERFVRRFAPYGFRAEAFMPAYGLAEVAVAFSFSPVGRGARVDTVERARFERAREARPTAPSGPHPLRFVSSGFPLPGYAVRIVDEAGHPLGERRVGLIEVRGPSLTPGYYRNPEATRAVLHDGWMDSGDLGYLADGELFVTGRRKDLIIVGGRNLYPSEIEEAVGELPGIRKGCVVAFGQASPELGTERLVVVAETRERAAEAHARLRAAITERLTEVLGLPPDEVLLAPPGSVRKTSSGKLRRGATRDAWVQGALIHGRGAMLGQYVRLTLSHARARLGRLLGLVSAAAYSLYIVLLLVLTALVLRVGLWRTPEGPPTDAFLRRLTRALFKAAGWRIRVEGLEHLQGPGPWVLTANHVSYLDPLALFAALPVDFRAVAKQEARSWPLVGTAVRRAGHLTVDRFDTRRGAEDAARATELLRQGTSVLFFPEGTRAPSTALLPFRLGAFKAAVEVRRPVVPIHIEGTHHILPRGWHLLRPGRITLSIREPLVPKGEGWPEMARLRVAARAGLAGTGTYPGALEAPPSPGQ
jgi:1-acyl-sn-glycerol-3-phosphate acyltransferase